MGLVDGNGGNSFELSQPTFHLALHKYVVWANERCLSVCATVCLSVCATVCLSVCATVCLSVCATVCLSVCATVCLSVCATVCGCPYSLDWSTGLDYWTGLLDSRNFMQKR